VRSWSEALANGNLSEKVIANAFRVVFYRVVHPVLAAPVDGDDGRRTGDSPPEHLGLLLPITVDPKAIDSDRKAAAGRHAV
jgi:hypothetical protein